jgi:antirestriction protein ArdC
LIAITRWFTVFVGWLQIGARTPTKNPRARPWVVSGNQGLPTSASTGKTYNGINAFILMMSGRANKWWMTYKQAKAVGGQVRAGEKGTTVIFYKPLPITDKETSEKKTIPMMKTFTVFNAEQIDDLPAKYFDKPVPRNLEGTDPEISDYVSVTLAAVRHGGDRAYYMPSTDHIQMPLFSQFDNGVSYYGTLLHELVHWTGATKRLDREIQNAHGNENYAKEELVAEIGAAFLAGHFGIEAEVRDDHAQYLASWLIVLKNDDSPIFTAAAAAQKAVEFLDGLQTQEEEKAA